MRARKGLVTGRRRVPRSVGGGGQGEVSSCACAAQERVTGHVRSGGADGLSARAGELRQERVAHAPPNGPPASRRDGERVHQSVSESACEVGEERRGEGRGGAEGAADRQRPEDALLGVRRTAGSDA